WLEIGPYQEIVYEFSLLDRLGLPEAGMDTITAIIEQEGRAIESAPVDVAVAKCVPAFVDQVYAHGGSDSLLHLLWTTAGEPPTVFSARHRAADGRPTSPIFRRVLAAGGTAKPAISVSRNQSPWPE